MSDSIGPVFRPPNGTWLTRVGTLTGNINDLLSRLEAFYDLHLDFPVEEEIVLRRLKYWSESQSGESFQAMIRQFYQDIWREDGSEAIQAVIFAFLREVDRLAVVSAPTTPRRVQSSRRLSFEIDAQLRPHWAQPLIGPSLNLLRDTIRKYEAQYNPDRHYSKAVSFVQASGMGKSRLADELGLYTSIVTFVLRADFENGFPRPDRAIRDFLLSNTEQDG